MFALAGLAAVLLPEVVQASQGGLLPRGNPGELVASDTALAQLAQAKGANAALLASADDSAEFIDPARTAARPWLKSHDAAPWFTGRQTATVWAACDGTAGISAGLWLGGWFATVWKRQKKLNYKWQLADAGPLAVMPPAPDWVIGKVADCPAHGVIPAIAPSAAPAGSDSRDQRSDDGSLAWRSTIHPDGSRDVQIWAYTDGAMHAVMARTVPVRLR